MFTGDPSPSGHFAQVTQMGSIVEMLGGQPLLNNACTQATILVVLNTNKPTGKMRKCTNAEKVDEKRFVEMVLESVKFKESSLSEKAIMRMLIASLPQPVTKAKQVSEASLKYCFCLQPAILISSSLFSFPTEKAAVGPSEAPMLRRYIFWGGEERGKA